MTDTIHVAISPGKLSYDYNRHAGASIISLLEHCSSPVTIHILYDETLSSENMELSEFNRACYQKISEKYGCELHFHHVEVPKWTKDIANVKKLTLGTLYRLVLPTILPDLEKIFYIDCDTIILTDITKIWNINLEGKYLAAVKDQCISEWNDQWKNHCSLRGISLDNYFNSGVLLLNLVELRKMSFADKALEYLKSNINIDVTPFVDQNALNYVCQNNFIELEWRYNNHSHLEEINDDCIMHFIGNRPKPWVEYTHPYNYIYWEYLRKSPWGEDKESFYNYQTSLIKYQRSIPNLSVTLPLLEQDFFLYIQGSKWKKIRYAFYFIWCMFKSFVRGILW